MLMMSYENQLINYKLRASRRAAVTAPGRAAPPARQHDAAAAAPPRGAGARLLRWPLVGAWAVALGHWHWPVGSLLQSPDHHSESDGHGGPVAVAVAARSYRSERPRAVNFFMNIIIIMYIYLCDRN